FLGRRMAGGKGVPRKSWVPLYELFPGTASPSQRLFSNRTGQVTGQTAVDAWNWLFWNRGRPWGVANFTPISRCFGESFLSWISPVLSPSTRRVTTDRKGCLGWNTGTLLFLFRENAQKGPLEDVGGRLSRIGHR